MIIWEDSYNQYPPLPIRATLYLCGYLETGSSSGGKVKSTVYKRHHWFRLERKPE